MLAFLRKDLIDENERRRRPEIRGNGLNGQSAGAAAKASARVLPLTLETDPGRRTTAGSKEKNIVKENAHAGIS